MIKWQWVLFEDLSVDILFEIMKIRQEVFVVEQNCAYQDTDDLDRVSWHLVGWREGRADREIVAYLRVVFPGKKYTEPSIGRVLTQHSARGQGIGKALLAEAIRYTFILYPDTHIRISAQRYLEIFYGSFGFKTISEPYDEDGIPHIEMILHIPSQ